MARQEITIISDDLDGSRGEDVSEVVFGYRTTLYGIDLSQTNRKALEEALAPFREKARKLGPLKLNHLPRRSASASASAPIVDREQNQAIREWARTQGYEISDRGRIPGDIVEEYHKLP